jgi:hypothetical protein
MAIMDAFLTALQLAPPWLSTVPTSGTVQPFTSQDVSVQFDATGLIGGDYAAVIRVNTNDPLALQIPIAATLHVTGAPDIEFTPSALEFGPVFVGGSRTETLMVRNGGTDVLHVSSVTVDNARYGVDTTSFQLAVGESLGVAVQFSPTVVAVEPGTVTLASDDPDEGVVQVALHGEGVIAPRIEVHPESLLAEVIPGERDTLDLVIDNTGGTELTFAILIEETVQDALQGSLPVDGAPQAGALAVDGGQFAVGRGSRKLWSGETIATAAGAITARRSGVGVAKAGTAARAGSPGGERPRSGVPWLTAVPDSGAVPPAGSFVVRMIFDSGQLPPGVDAAMVRIFNNDPLRPRVDIPAQLHVVGRPRLTLSHASLDFGMVFQGSLRDLAVEARNTGTEPLSVDSTWASTRDYSVTPRSFALAPDEALQLHVVFRPSALGGGTQRDATVHLSTNEPAIAELPVSGRTARPPDVSLQPPSLDITVAQGDSAMRKLNLCNTGHSSLEFSARVLPMAGPAVARYETPPLAKGEADTRPGILGHGGPDAFGYRWIDSNEPGGPQFAWVDISASGTPIPFSAFADEENRGPYPIGFAFPFYGNAFSSFRVCTNGWLSFTNVISQYSNLPLPNGSAPENLLAVLWDDLVYTSPLSRAYYQSDAGRCIVQFNDLVHFGNFSPPHYSFQVILYPDGEIVFQYLTVGTVSNSATVGIQNATRDDGLTVVYNANYLHDNLAVRFTSPEPSWIRFAPRSGEVPAGQCASLGLEIFSSGIAPGDHLLQILVNSNDPDEPAVYSYVVVHVIGAIEASVELDPSTLDLSQRSGRVTAYVELPPSLDVHELETASLRLAGVTPEAQPAVIGDHDEDQVPDVALSFDRGALHPALPEGRIVTLPLTGRLQDGQSIRALVHAEVRRHAVEAPNGGETLLGGSTNYVRWSVPEGWTHERADIFFSPDDGRSWRRIASGVGVGSYNWQVPNQATTQGRIRIELFDALGSLGVDTSDETFSIQARSTDTEGDVPRVYALEQNVPNPFNPTTRIRFAVPEPGRVRLSVYDTEGRMVRALLDAELPAGRHVTEWEGHDASGQRVASGVYFYRLTAGKFTDTRRMVMLK